MAPRRTARAVLAAALAAAAVLAPAPVRAADGPAPPTIVRKGEFVGRVNDAIEKGVGWLRAAKAADGSYPGYGGNPCGIQALAYHTLRVCGVPRDDPDAKLAWDSLRGAYAKSGRGTLQTYSAALVLMAIAEHGDRVADRFSDREVRLTDSDRAWAEEVTRWIVGAQNPDGTWTYGSADDRRYARRGQGPRPYDNSNSQYALLGLKAAARCGLAIDSKVWVRAMQHFLDTQDETGSAVLRFDPSATRKGATSAGPATDHARGWGYVGTGSPYGSMTAGGVGSVVICRSELLGTAAMPKALEAASETSLRDGIAWLGRNFTVRTNPGPRSTMAGLGWHHYYLYAIERAGVLSGVEWMADHDWYGEGADHLCDSQSDGGGWSSGLVPGLPGIGGDGGRGPARRAAPRPTVLVNASTVLDTCFALLFLKRGTMPVRRGALTQAADDSDVNFGAAAALTGQDFEDFIDLVLQRWRRTDDEDVRRRLFDGATSVGPKIVEPLLVRMDSPEEKDRTAAHALLRHATGKDFHYEPGASAEIREVGVVGWQTWWLSAKARIAYDASIRRLAETPGAGR